MTDISKIREYQVYQSQVANGLRPNMNEAMGKSKEVRMPVHRTVVRQYDHHHFACHIIANALQAQAIIYMMTPTDASFETIVYYPEKKVYCLITPHVFQRYQERLEINRKKKGQELLYHFAMNNGYVEFINHNPNEPKGKGITVRVDKGIIYGTKRAGNVFYLRTFISRDMLTKEQREELKTLDKNYKNATREKLFKGI